jgi:anti-sigma regulatory factor (Ser/Thr protein kinase)
MDTRRYTATSDTVRDARQFVYQQFDRHPAQGDAYLLASELAANAVRHGDHTGTYTVTVELVDDNMRVTVRNSGAASAPVPRQRRPQDAENGRGLAFVVEFAAAWGCSQDDDVTEVWFEFPVRATEHTTELSGSVAR